jgi:hypothetical protein
MTLPERKIVNEHHYIDKPWHLQENLMPKQPENGIHRITFPSMRT